MLQSVKLVKGEIGNISYSTLLLATIMAGICGYAAVKWMISILQKGSLKGFAFYVWLLGGFILIAQFTGLF
jgi:undecaprenyl-diphosphatase